MRGWFALVLPFMAGCGLLLGLDSYAEGDAEGGRGGASTTTSIGGSPSGQQGGGAAGGVGGAGGEVVVTRTPIVDWVVHLTGNGDDNLGELAVTASDFVYTCGTFDGSLSAGGNGVTSNGRDIYVAGIGDRGEISWLQRYGDDGAVQQCRGVAADTGNFARLTGSVLGGITLTTPMPVPGSPFSEERVFVLSIAQSGNQFNWATTGNPMDGKQVGLSIAPHPNKGVYVSGAFTETLDSANQTAVTSAAFDAGFAFRLFAVPDEWTTGQGASPVSVTQKFTHGVDVLADGTPVFVGDFGGMLYPGGVVANGRDAFAVVLDQDTGDVVDLLTFGGPASESAVDVATDTDGDIVIAANYRSGFDIMGMPVATPVGDGILIVKLERDLTPIWIATFDEPGHQRVTSIDADRNNNIYFSGLNEGMVNFDEGAQIGPGAYVAGLTSNGELRFVEGFSASEYADAKSVAASPTEDELVVGIEFRGTVNIDGTDYTAPDAGEDVIVVRYRLE